MTPERKDVIANSGANQMSTQERSLRLAFDEIDRLKRDVDSKSDLASKYFGERCDALSALSAKDDKIANLDALIQRIGADINNANSRLQACENAHSRLGEDYGKSQITIKRLSTMLKNRKKS